ncbi:hypothetical protein BAUCODRAFT_154775 [Baudoinia panamericana UAMH 10762]|uniref:AMP-dependent synthetase/ligase domain-containing protein n=1 Tax=Baudoinia panamericana (strain UAMH 10762) TaxID=717646 RepID=M2LWR0_BAUPA|nr:uncharacterized protein BAUCODRAFT_154775 [Baudoinia panamericana UAMH 10762]EMC99102.1 hypothetical protein BAUCODRAFT_154775 [Baudoinia panamericana UAMH 10762]
MPLLATQHATIPTTDLLTWSWNNRHAYNQDRPIYVDCTNPDRRISAAEAWSLIRKLVAGFQHAGLQPGDCVCIHAFNNLYYPILVQGIIGAGGVWVGTNPSYTSFELHHTLKLSKARFVIAEPELLATIRDPATDLGVRNVFLFDAQSGRRVPELPHWETLLNHGEAYWVSFDDMATAKSTTAMLLFSSGTTGLPKAAQVSHYNLIAQHTILYENLFRPWPFPVSMITCLPFFHAANATYVHTTTLRSGFPSYVMRRFDLSLFLTSMERFAVTWQILVPPIFSALLNYAKTHGNEVRQALRSVRTIGTGAAPLDKNTQNELRAYLPPGATCIQGWAMSETSCLACLFIPPEDDDTGSVGRFLPNLDVKLVDPENPDKELPTYDVRGELCIRGPTVIRGYLDNPEANSRDWDKDGYFHTGDILYCNGSTGLWYIVDRKKELIKVRGFQVAPNELEVRRGRTLPSRAVQNIADCRTIPQGVLLSHPAILDTAVIGVKSNDGASELPRAYVVLREGKDLSESHVRGWMEERLAPYKRLVGGVRFVDVIPKTASGKILKRVLREQAVGERERISKL